MKKICRTNVTLLIVLGFVLRSSLCMAEEKEKAAPDHSKTLKTPKNDEKPAGFLGLIVEEIHPAIASHLPDTMSTEQGVVVHEVTEDSPAAKAGIKVHDILMTYDDQKLFAPEQLHKLVASDRSGREVKLGLIRQGQQQTLAVQLGNRESVAAHAETPNRRRMRRFSWPWAGRRDGPGKTPAEVGRPGWNSFDSMTLKKLDKDRFHALINHTDKAGKLQKHEFEGTREEIRKKIEMDQDLTPDERTHLLRSLDFYEPGIPIVIFPDEPWPDF